jgi:hypothetical protein
MVVVGGAHGRANGQRTMLSFSGSFSQPKVELRHLAQLTCQATSMRWAGKMEGCRLMDRTHQKNPEKIM